MELKTRELFRTEIKSLTYHRRLAKSTARKHNKTASSIMREALQGDGPVYKNPLWERADSHYSAALWLRYSKAHEARHFNIAYGLLRGVPYKSIEAKCEVSPSAEKVFEIIQSMASWKEKREWTLDKVKELLK
jgi:hypothetical protein